MSVYVIACLTVNPEAEDDLRIYLDVAMPLVQKMGGKVTQNFTVGELVVGSRIAEAIMVVEYPDIETVHALFDSPEYKSIVPNRDRAFSTYNVSIIS